MIVSMASQQILVRLLAIPSLLADLRHQVVQAWDLMERITR